MKHICKNCKHCLEHPYGRFCNKNLIFVQKDGPCDDFETKEMSDTTKLVLFTIVVLGIVIFLSKIL